MSDEPRDCACDTCRKACENKPGWFLPGEAERTANLLGMSLPDFFRAHLAVDWFEGDGQVAESDTFVLAPVLVGEPAGEEYPSDPEGRCSLLTPDGRCSIHAAKPHECRAYLHNEPVGDRHAEVARVWVAHQGQIRTLLGRGPIATQYTGGGLFGLFGGWDSPEDYTDAD